jgi:predicted RNA binding protein YcfA (HicA-like mRNA interferase family)
MPPFGPIHRRELIRELKKLGFSGPFAGGKHEFMIREVDQLRLFVPNPHKGEISRSLLGEILREAGISRAEWERL